jgi:hypothetical protein
MSPRAATFGAFFLNGAMIGTWVAQIPFVQERLDVSKATIGLALLCMATGAMIAMPLTGQILDRRPSATVTRTVALIYLPLLALPLFAPTPVWLGLALLLFGAANGSMDVAMNAHGVAVERTLGRPIMSSLHAGWSFGGLAGSGGVALAVALGVDPRIEGVVASAVLWLMALGITARLEAERHRQRHAARARQATEAPAGVQRGHDRLAERPLDRDAVAVHRDVHRAVRGAEHHQHRAERDRRRRVQRQRQQRQVDDRGHARDARAGEPIEQLAGQRHRDHRAGGHAQQGEADRALGDVEPLLQERDLRDPRADHRAVQEEGAERRCARAHAATTLTPAAA